MKYKAINDMAALLLLQASENISNHCHHLRNTSDHYLPTILAMIFWNFTMF